MTTETDYQRSYSLADIARKLGRPRTTVQSWRDQFKKYLPTISGTHGRTTRYDAKALALFELIARMKDDNEPPSMIEKVLTENVKIITIDHDDISENQLPMMAQIYEGFRQVAAAMEEQRQHNEEITTELKELRQLYAVDQHNLAENQRELLKQLEQQNFMNESIKARDATLLEAMRELQEKKQEEKRKKGLFSWIFNR
ncbi:MerR family transcriptional regulator [Oceanobacillus damuensis]|uniref:MerR family transcriptional regulator n=1 Tax=Oceanobacillus damuensis TaxID=937928 RepID=UPI00082DE4A2|nr:MerR family transcriptional regulator [Oceanobacillus damuensis]